MENDGNTLSSVLPIEDFYKLDFSNINGVGFNNIIRYTQIFLPGADFGIQFEVEPSPNETIFGIGITDNYANGMAVQKVVSGVKISTDDSNGISVKAASAYINTVFMPGGFETYISEAGIDNGRFYTLKSVEKLSESSLVITINPDGELVSESSIQKSGNWQLNWTDTPFLDSQGKFDINTDQLTGVTFGEALLTEVNYTWFDANQNALQDSGDGYISLTTTNAIFFENNTMTVSVEKTYYGIGGAVGGSASSSFGEQDAQVVDALTGAPDTIGGRIAEFV